MEVVIVNHDAKGNQMITSKFLKTFEDLPVIAILRGLRPDECLDVGHALLESGIRIIEVPLNSPDPFESISRLLTSFGSQAVIGAGTVLEPHQVDQLADIGGEIVVAPNTNTATISRAADLGLATFPGIMTPTDAFAAIKAGATGVKVFPAGVVGTGFIRALKDVIPKDKKVCAVGGVGAENVEEWFAAGVDAIGVGSGLFSAGDTAGHVANKARDLVEAVRRVTSCKI